jgi:hypothetical protein
MSKVVSEGKIDLIKGSRHSSISSHCLYADDIVVFCRGKSSDLQALKSLFTNYANCFGQIINAAKSIIFAGGISQSRLKQIVNFIGRPISQSIFAGHSLLITYELLFSKEGQRLATFSF